VRVAAYESNASHTRGITPQKLLRGTNGHVRNWWIVRLAPFSEADTHYRTSPLLQRTGFLSLASVCECPINLPSRTFCS
jgi:hypothetical protein